MAAGVRPAATKAFGTEKWVFVTTLTNPDSPSLAELGAASSLDVTNMFFESSARPQTNTNFVTPERRIGDTEQFQFVGTDQHEFGQIQYSFNPQAAALSDGKKAFEKFPRGTTGYLVRRFGPDRNTDLAVGQFVTSFPVEFGAQNEVPVGTGESAEVAITQGVAITAAPSLNKAIVA